MFLSISINPLLSCFYLLFVSCGITTGSGPNITLRKPLTLFLHFFFIYYQNTNKENSDYVVRLLRMKGIFFFNSKLNKFRIIALEFNYQSCKIFC